MIFTFAIVIIEENFNEHNRNLRILPLSRERYLKPSWKYRTEGTLWRLLPAAHGLLVGEDRDRASKTTSFFCLAETSGKPKWERIRFPEDWWIGLETVHRDVLFLHEYVRPDLPTHGKIIAVDLASGRMLWSNGELRFQFAQEDWVYACKDNYKSRQYFRLDLYTGMVLRDDGVQTDYATRIRADTASHESDDAKYPQPTDVSIPERHSLPHSFVQTLTSQRISAIELLEEPPYLIVGYYAARKTSLADTELDQHLKVFDTVRGKLAYEDVMARSVKSPAPGLFFSRHGYLFYIKDNNTLVGVRLDRSNASRH